MSRTVAGVVVASFAVLMLGLPAGAELTKEETGRNTPYPQDNGGTGACDNYRCDCGDACGCGQGCGCGSSTEPMTVRGGVSFESSNVALLSRVSVQEFGGGLFAGNDCWGYVSGSGREYALMGLNAALAVVEITDPSNPVVLSNLVAHADSDWADVKTFGSHAYVVNESGGGVQIIDLSAVDAGTVTLVGSFDLGGSANTNHNIAINETSGFAYLCGSNGFNGGLVAVDLSNPTSPVLAGAYTDHYVHDAEIVSYTAGPLAGREIAYCFVEEQGLDIVDVTDKNNIFRVSRTTYAGAEYSHQGWLDPATNLLYLNDELDERRNGVNITTRVFDVADIATPALVGTFTNGLNVIDHNLYARDGFLYESNYRSGLRIFDATGDPLSPVEAGWFDTFDGPDDTEFDGAWSVYPFFPSGNVIVSDIQGGLFVLDPTLALIGGTPATIELLEPVPALIDPFGQTLRVRVDAVSGFALTTAPAVVVDGVPNDLVANGDGTFTAAFPALGCGDVVSYYFSVGTSAGIEVREPLNAPAVPLTGLVASEFTIEYADDFQSSSGWTVGSPKDSATSGIWINAIPTETAAQPGVDNPEGEGTLCYITGASASSLGDNDVDGGSTTLTSPTLDATGDGVAFVEYARWYSNDRGAAPKEDAMLIEISDDDGASWVTLELVTENANRWVTKRFRVDDFVTPTDQLRLRFIASDEGSGSIVEAGVDDVRVRLALCVASVAADLDGSGAVDSTDLAILLAAWATPAADLDGDGDTSSSDLAILLAAWG